MQTITPKLRYKIRPPKRFKMNSGKYLIVFPVWDFKEGCLIEFAGYTFWDCFQLYDRCGGNTELLDTDISNLSYPY